MFAKTLKRVANPFLEEKKRHQIKPIWLSTIVSEYFALGGVGSICSMCLELRERIAYSSSVSM